jgi:hypothetical protein
LHGLRIGDESEYVKVIRIVVAVLAFIQFRHFLNFGEYERGFDWIQSVRLVQRVMKGVSARANDVGKVLFTTPLRQNPCRKLIARPNKRGNFYLGVFLFKSLDHAIVFIAATVERQLSVALGGPHRFFPFGLPIGLRETERRN